MTPNGVAALAYRLHAVGVLSEWHYRQIYIEISKRGYRTREPEEAPRETFEPCCAAAGEQAMKRAAADIAPIVSFPLIAMICRSRRLSVECGEPDM